MTERLVQIGTPPETLIQFEKEAFQDPTIANLIADNDSALVTDILIEAGYIERGDAVAVCFVTDTDSPQDPSIVRARIYAAHRTPQGDVVATDFLEECVLKIDIDNWN